MPSSKESSPILTLYSRHQTMAWETNQTLDQHLWIQFYKARSHSIVYFLARRVAPNTRDSMHMLWKLIHPLPDTAQTDKHTSLWSTPRNSAGLFQWHCHSFTYFLYRLVIECCIENSNCVFYMCKFSKSSQSLEGIKQCVWFKTWSLEGNNILCLLISSPTKSTDLSYLNDPHGLFLISP